MSELETAEMQDESSSTMDDVKQQTKEQVQGVTDQARSKTREQVNQRTTEVGEQATSVASSLRQTSQTMRDEGDMRKADMMDKTAEQVDRVGNYLIEVDADQLGRRVRDFGRERPWLLAGAGFLAGLAIARFLKASAESEEEEGPSPSYLDTGTAPSVETAPPLDEPVSPGVTEPEREGV